MRIAPTLFVSLALLASIAFAEPAATQPPQPPFPYVWGKAFHVLPETHNQESGYFSLCEGLDGRIYVGTTRYFENSYLVEFDPATEQQRVVIDTNAVCGVNGTNYASQAKIHTRNFVAPSGVLWCGSMQGYGPPGDTSRYEGGFVMTYDPNTGAAKSHGIAYPGEGVSDVIADEARGLAYIVTSMNWRWVLMDIKTGKYRPLGVALCIYARTMIDERGRANAVTEEFRLAQHDPVTDVVTLRDIRIDGRSARELAHPRWTQVSDGKTAYMVCIDNEEKKADLYAIDLLAEGDTVPGRHIATLARGSHLDCNCGLDLGPDGKLYAVITRENDSGFGAGDLQHLVRVDPQTGAVEQLGVLAVKNPDYFAFTLPDGNPAPYIHGFNHDQPDGTLTPKSNHLALKVARDGTIYVTFLYPFTLLQIAPEQLGAGTSRRLVR